MTFILSVLEILQKRKIRKKLRGPFGPVCPTLLIPHAHFLPVSDLLCLLVPTRDCIPKLTFLTCKWCFPLGFRCFRQRKETPAGDLRMGREVVVIITSGATAQVPPCMFLEWLCPLQLQFLSSLFSSKATGFVQA